MVMRKGKKQEKKLNSRRADFSSMLNSGNHEAKVGSRINGGGFHRPGSNKK